MLMRRTAKLLLDAREAALEIETLTAGRPLDAMHTDRGLQLSVYRLLEILGGALDRLQTVNPEMAAIIPDLRRFVDLRDQIEGCDPSAGDRKRIWQLATQHVPGLRIQLDNQLLNVAAKLDEQETSSRPAERQVIALVSRNMDAIADLCRKFNIRKLDVFGSVATGAFDPETSDVDFIVDFGEYEAGTAWKYFDFTDALEEILGRKVELLTEVQIKNPYFRQSVEEQRINVFRAGDREAAA